MSVSARETAEPLLQTLRYEKLLEVLTRAVARLDLAWPAEPRTANLASKLGERFLKLRHAPANWGLPFFPDLHTAVARSWKRPYLAGFLSGSQLAYANAVGLKEQGYLQMPRMEQTLASCLSPQYSGIVRGPEATLQATEGYLGINRESLHSSRPGYGLPAHYIDAAGLSSRAAARSG